ncbi:MAG: hypothetical protein HQ565_10150 [Bacteroidetes bacterium]|nr:hypothetical protein [Bacteroidota bacterium]
MKRIYKIKNFSFLTIALIIIIASSCLSPKERYEAEGFKFEFSKYASTKINFEDLSMSFIEEFNKKGYFVINPKRKTLVISSEDGDELFRINKMKKSVGGYMATTEKGNIIIIASDYTRIAIGQEYSEIFLTFILYDKDVQELNEQLKEMASYLTFGISESESKENDEPISKNKNDHPQSKFIDSYCLIYFNKYFYTDNFKSPGSQPVFEDINTPVKFSKNEIILKDITFKLRIEKSWYIDKHGQVEMELHSGNDQFIYLSFDKKELFFQVDVFNFSTLSAYSILLEYNSEIELNTNLHNLKQIY